MTVERRDKRPPAPKDRQPKPNATKYNDRAEINRRNAQKSTGPKTIEGILRASRNAVTHGMTAITFETHAHEDPVATHAHQKWYVDSYGIHDPIHATILEDLVNSSLLMRRSRSYHAAHSHRAAVSTDIDIEIGFTAKVPDSELSIDLLWNRLKADTANVNKALRATPEGRASLCRFWRIFLKGVEDSVFGRPPHKYFDPAEYLTEKSPARTAEIMTFMKIELKLIDKFLTPKLLHHTAVDRNPAHYDPPHQQAVIDVNNCATELFKRSENVREYLRAVARLELEHIGQLTREHAIQSRLVEFDKRLDPKTRARLAQLPDNPQTGALILRYLGESSRWFYRAYDKFKEHRLDLGLPLGPDDAGSDEADDEANAADDDTPDQAPCPPPAWTKPVFPSDPSFLAELETGRRWEQYALLIHKQSLVEGGGAFVTPEMPTVGAALKRFALTQRALARAAEASSMEPAEVTSRNEANEAQLKTDVKDARFYWAPRVMSSQPLYERAQRARSELLAARAAEAVGATSEPPPKPVLTPPDPA